MHGTPRRTSSYDNKIEKAKERQAELGNPVAKYKDRKRVIYIGSGVSVEIARDHSLDSNRQLNALSFCWLSALFVSVLL